MYSGSGVVLKPALEMSKILKMDWRDDITVQRAASPEDPHSRLIPVAGDALSSLASTAPVYIYGTHSDTHTHKVREIVTHC